MKKSQILIVLFLLIPFIILAQNKVPKNLRQAIKILENNYQETLKSAIVKTDTDSLLTLIYPWGGKDKTIGNWINDSIPEPHLVSYLSKRGIKMPKHQELAVLMAFKEHLKNGFFKEREVLKPIQDIEKKFDDEEKIKFTTEKLNGVYIPKDLEDCFRQLDTIWKISVGDKLKRLGENEHFGLGLWMRNNWALWRGSRLSSYFNTFDIYHPDDMSGIILKTYSRHLKHEDLQFEELKAYYINYWQDIKNKEKNKKDSEFSGYKIGDIVLFLYGNGFVSKEQEQKYDNDLCLAKGIITEKDQEYYSIKVRLIESCDPKGIISYDNIGSLVYNKKSGRYETPKKREIIKLKQEKEAWFNYKDWEPDEKN